jgi:Bacterial Ig-like domain (group 2)
MRRFQQALALAVVIATGACSADITGRQPAGPRRTITSSTVTCPDTISVGQSTQCVAYFYDENHNLVSTTPTWGTNTSSLLSVGSTGVITGLAVGTAEVHATAGSVTGSRNVYVKPGLSVYITGPTTLPKLDPCQWGAVPSGGTPPYTYVWTKSGGYGSGSGDTFSGYLVSSGMNLTVTVTDANGLSKAVTLSVIGSPYAPTCY